MRDEGLAFDAALAEAQKLGYAEADPSLDVDGHDAAQKLVVITHAGVRRAAWIPDLVPVEGIRGHRPDRFPVRRIASASRSSTWRSAATSASGVELRVHPALIPKNSVLANIDGVLNGVFIVGRALGPCLLVGRGAGDMPTAVSVVADIVDVARSHREGEPGLGTRGIQIKDRGRSCRSRELAARYYLRFDVADHPGRARDDRHRARALRA